MAYCAQCGNQILEGSNFCNKCGTPVSGGTSIPASSSGAAAQTATLPAPVIAAPDVEHTFFKEGGVSVTNKRFIVPGQTYAMAAVTSVAFSEIPAKRGWPLFFAFIGLLLALGDSTRVVGILLLVAGIGVAVMMKSDYAVALRSAGGEIHATTSKDEQFITRVVEAINNAIVYRQ
jgi:hypothetical protein